MSAINPTSSMALSNAYDYPRTSTAQKKEKPEPVNSSLDIRFRASVDPEGVNLEAENDWFLSGINFNLAPAGEDLQAKGSNNDISQPIPGIANLSLFFGGDVLVSADYSLPFGSPTQNAMTGAGPEMTRPGWSFSLEYNGSTLTYQPNYLCLSGEGVMPGKNPFGWSIERETGNGGYEWNKIEVGWPLKQFMINFSVETEKDKRQKTDTLFQIFFVYIPSGLPQENKPSGNGSMKLMPTK